jgi:hypothetical protein
MRVGGGPLGGVVNNRLGHAVAGFLKEQNLQTNLHAISWPRLRLRLPLRLLHHLVGRRQNPAGTIRPTLAILHRNGG